MRTAFPVGSEFAVLKESMEAQGFEGGLVLQTTFQFQRLEGWLKCGHSVGGEIGRDGRITKLRAYQGCFGH